MNETEKLRDLLAALETHLRVIPPPGWQVHVDVERQLVARVTAQSTLALAEQLNRFEQLIHEWGERGDAT